MPLKLAQADAERPKSLKILNPATNRYVNIDSKIGRLVAVKLDASAKPTNVATVDVSTFA